MGANMHLFYIKKLKMQEKILIKKFHPTHKIFLTKKLDKYIFYTILETNNHKTKGEAHG